MERAAKASARREAWRAQQAAGTAGDADWQRFGKYDMLQALLAAAAAEPEAQARVRAVSMTVPRVCMHTAPPLRSLDAAGWHWSRARLLALPFLALGICTLTLARGPSLRQTAPVTGSSRWAAC